jgi:hypothetical protein
MIDPLCVDRAASAHNPMHFISFVQQEFRKIGTILPGDSRNQCPLHIVPLIYIKINSQIQGSLTFYVSGHYPVPMRAGQGGPGATGDMAPKI